MSHGKASASHGLLHEVLHHLAVSTVIASVLLILAAQGYLNGLDSLFLRITSALSRPAVAATKVVAPGNEDTLVLMIGSHLYEDSFGQTSPLDRARLARLLEGIAAQSPRVLAVDLDISPASPDLLRQKQDSLDEAVIRLAGKARVVLTTPMPVASLALRQAKLAWMQRLCRAGVDFAFPFLALSQSMVLRYPADASLLGMRVLAGQEEKGPCELAGQGMEKAFFLGEHFDPVLYFQAESLAGQVPLGTEFLSDWQRHSRILDSLDTPSSWNLRGKVVFLGGGYDARDEFPTPFGMVKGVALHAAIYQSAQMPKSVMGHGAACALDIVIGVLAAFIFAWTWQRYDDAAMRFASHPENWRAYLAARSWMAGNLLLLVLSILLVLSLSTFLLERHLWNNPGPILIGVFMKSLLASRAGIRAIPEARAVASRGGTFRPAYCDWLVGAGIVAWALLLLGHH